MPLVAASSEVFSSQAFYSQPPKGGGYALAGQGYMLAGEGIGKSKIRQTVKTVKKIAPKAARAGLRLAEQFGNEKTQKRASDLRLAGKIVQGSGPCPPLPGSKLKALLAKAKKKM